MEEAALKRSNKISLAKLLLVLIFFNTWIWPNLHAACRVLGSAGLWFRNRGQISARLLRAPFHSLTWDGHTQTACRIRSTDTHFLIVKKVSPQGEVFLKGCSRSMQD